MIFILAMSLILASYVATSIFFFKFPTILRKKKDVKFKGVHISHRGGAGEQYENTMTAFKRAIDLGTDMLELDCHLTKDGQVVVAHDPSLQRSTDSVGNISEMIYGELPPLKKSLPIDFMPGEVFTGSTEDRRFPLLEEVFTAFPNMAINVDIKANNDLLISKVNALIKTHNREKLTVWGNSKDAVAQKCFKENPNVGLFFSMKRTLVLIGLTYTGLLPFIPIKETHLETLIPSQALRVFETRFGSKWWHRYLAKLATALLIRPCLFQHLKKRGIPTYLWVLNTEEDFKVAFEAGASGVMTDYPSKLKDFLDRNPQYKKKHSS